MDKPDKTERSTKSRAQATPYEYMRATRPYLFSDSTEQEQPSLTETLLEYHLESLNNRSQEHDFEKFAHRLAEREICPNLIPQTGPTGGGDSKSDAITHPVAETLIDRWFWGSASPSRGERWAFAFSIKKDWKAKVKDDVKKLASLKTKPDRIFFLSNQFVPDKARDAAEQQLGKQYGIPLTIYDRQWITRRVVDRGHHQLAIEALHISVPVAKTVKIGPNDASRKAELADLLEKLKKPHDNYPSEYTLAEDYLRAAFLSRSIENEHYETRHYHEQAIKFAKAFGNVEQIYRAIYDYAWTAFWWFQDPSKTSELYGELNEMLKSSRDVELYDKAKNLMSLLGPWEMEQGGALSPLFQERKLVLFKGLDEISADITKPNAALEAKTIKEMVNFQCTVLAKDLSKIEQHFNNFNKYIKDSVGLLHYPVKAYCDALLNIGDLLGGMAGYDNLVETIQQVTAKRQGEAAEGRVVLQRGQQLLKLSRGTDAILAFKKAQELLSKQESIHLCAVSMYLCGTAYEQEGLLWAARSELVNCMRLAFRELSSADKWLTLAIKSSMKLAWVELQLGRVPWIIAWYYTALTLMNKFVNESGRAKYKDLENEFGIFDSMVGLLFMKAEVGQLAHLTKLPDTLENVGLYMAEYALLYSLGYTDELIKQQYPLKFKDYAEVNAFYQRAASNPGYAQVPSELILQVTRREELKTKLLGCTITLVTDNEIPCIVVAETFIGALEGLFAETTYNGFVFSNSSIVINIRKGDFVANPPEIRTDNLGTERITDIVVAADFLDWANSQGYKILVEWCHSLIARLLASEIIFSKGISKTIGKIAQRGAFSRALSLVPLITSYALNPEQGFLDYWLPDSNAEYPLRRDRPWNAESPKQDTSDTNSKASGSGKKLMAGEPPEDVKNMVVRHAEMQVFDHIDVRLWDAAKWYGTALLRFPIAGLGFIFKNENLGWEIFTAWRKKFGKVDTYEEIRISIIENINDTGSYLVTIGGNMEGIYGRLEAEGKSVPKRAMIPSRGHQMDPERGSQNLSLFKQKYDAANEYIIFPGCMDSNLELRPFFDLSIKKKRLIFREMKDLKPDDEDYSLAALSSRGDADTSK